jgi:hypothetical protein
MSDVLAARFPEEVKQIRASFMGMNKFKANMLVWLSLLDERIRSDAECETTLRQA